LQERINMVNSITGQHLRYNDLLKARVDVDFVIRLEQNNDSHTISNKIFDFYDITIRQLIYNGYKETQPQMNRILSDIALISQDK
jgi:NTE family protein